MLARILEQQKTKREKKVIMLGTMHRTQTPINLVRDIGHTEQNGKKIGEKNGRYRKKTSEQNKSKG